MGKQKVEKEIYISGPHHDERISSRYEKSSIDDFYKRIMGCIDAGNYNSFYILLRCDFYLNENEIYYHNNGYHTRTYCVNWIQPCIEVLFEQYPEKFLEIFNKIKEDPNFLYQFYAAINSTDLNVLRNEWSERTLKKVRENLAALERYTNVLTKEVAQVETRQVSSFTTKLYDIVTPDSSSVRLRADSKHTFLSVSPGLVQRIEFAATLQCQLKNQQFDNHRKFYKVVLANLLLAALGGVVLYGIAVCINKNYFFANTARRKKLENLKTSLPQKKLSHRM